jgi:hypothetical protein
MKLPHRHQDLADAESRRAAGLEVERIYAVDDPLWYLRLTSQFRLNWRRELATVAGVFVLGFVIGHLVAR